MKYRKSQQLRFGSKLEENQINLLLAVYLMYGAINALFHINFVIKIHNCAVTSGQLHHFLCIAQKSHIMISTFGDLFHSISHKTHCARVKCYKYFGLKRNVSSTGIIPVNVFSIYFHLLSETQPKLTVLHFSKYMARSPVDNKSPDESIHGGIKGHKNMIVCCGLIRI